MEPLSLVALGVFGVLVGVLGAMVGAGGGFLVVPVLMLVLDVDHKLAVGTSSAVVAVSAASAVRAYLGQKRVDVRLGLALAASMLPGIAGGFWLLYKLPTGGFKGAFGGLLLFTSLALILRNLPGTKKRLEEAGSSDGSDARPSGFSAWRRRVKDSYGIEHAYRVDLRLGLSTSAGIGLLPALFGVGGGIVQTPVLVLLLGVPMHIAAATSQLVIALTGVVTAGTHIYAGNVDYPMSCALAIGVFIGAPIGATIGRRVSGRAIAFVLALILGVVAIRLILSGIGVSLTS